MRIWIVDRILKILKLLHEELEEKVLIQMIDNLIRENCNLTIINFNKRFVCFKILKSDFNICIFYCTVLVYI